jgi:hypothetical protein
MGSGMEEAQPNSAYRDIGILDIIVAAAAGFPFYLFFDWKGEPFRALVAAMSAACLCACVLILWPLVRQAKFWLALAGVGVAHALLVYFLPYRGDFRFGYALFPLFFVDWYASARFIGYVCDAKFS